MVPLRLGYRRDQGRHAGFIVPSGNIGNAVGAFWAKRLGFPVREIALATNANRVVPDWFGSGEWKPRPSVKTLANAMDVGDPSNMERLFHLYPKREAMLAAQYDSDRYSRYYPTWGYRPGRPVHRPVRPGMRPHRPGRLPTGPGRAPQRSSKMTWNSGQAGL